VKNVDCRPLEWGLIKTRGRYRRPRLCLCHIYRRLELSEIIEKAPITSTKSVFMRVQKIDPKKKICLKEGDAQSI